MSTAPIPGKPENMSSGRYIGQILDQNKGRKEGRYMMVRLKLP